MSSVQDKRPGSCMKDGTLCPGLLHLFAKAERTHVSPYFRNVGKAVGLVSFEACGIPSIGHRTMGSPDGILLLIVFYDQIFLRVFANFIHSDLSLFVLVRATARCIGCVKLMPASDWVPVLFSIPYWLTTGSSGQPYRLNSMGAAQESRTGMEPCKQEGGGAGKP